MAVNCGAGRRFGSDPMLLWLWHSSYRSNLIPNLGLHLPWVLGVALKRPKKKKKKKKESEALSCRTWEELVFSSGWSAQGELLATLGDFPV